MQSIPTKTVLLTGGARRIGAGIARALHRAGMNLALHYRFFSAQAAALRDELNRQRPDSVLRLPAELRNTAGLPALVEQTIDKWGRLDALINNASSFFATLLGQTTEADLFLLQDALYISGQIIAVDGSWSLSL